jgi:hypothetical protein
MGYGAQPSTGFKVQVRAADMEIPCPGHQGDIRQWRYTYVLYFPAVRLGSESEVFFRTPDQKLLFYLSNWVSSSYSTRDRPEGEIFSFVTVV